MTAFRRLITQRELNVKLFFLVDGLDEFDGDCEVLAELFNEIIRASDHANHNIKCCVSSRPWVVFKENFEDCPSLPLQDLTFSDIQKFVEEKFKSNSAFQKLAVQEPQATSKLIQEVVSKADGVFLWVHIVVKELLRGIRNHDKIPDLLERLEALPRDLEPLYHRIMSQIDSSYLVWASKTFQIVRATREIIIPAALNFDESASTRGLISLAELYFALDESFSNVKVELMSQETLDGHCTEMEYQITARCACLLEVVNENTKSKSVVQYLHRTARDFLETQEGWHEILNRTQGSKFDPFWQVVRCNSLMIHWQLRGDRGGRLNTGYLHNKIVTMLHVAAHHVSHTQRIRVLDDTNDLLLRRDIDIMSNVFIIRWNDLVPNQAISQSVRGSLIACALAINFSDYIDAKLNDLFVENFVAARTTSTHMLSGHLYSSGRYGAKYASLLSLGMASVLIKYGANVNYRIGGSSQLTVWEDFLTQSFIVPDSTGVKRYLSPDFVPMMILFLSSGADSSVSVLAYGKRISLLEFFESYILPNYPSQAGELREAIMKASRFNVTDSQENEMATNSRESEIATDSQESEIAISSQESKIAANGGGDSSNGYVSRAPKTREFSFRRMMRNFLSKS